MTVVLGLAETHVSTACICDDGKIIACASEERFTRKKQQEGFPKKAIEWALTQTDKPIDKVCLHFKDFVWGSMMEFSGQMPFARKLYRNIVGNIEYRIPFASFVYQVPQGIASMFMIDKWNKEHLDMIERELGVRRDNILPFLHEETHIATAKYGNNFGDEPYLIFTLDGAGDKSCGTVSKVEDGWTTLLASTDNRDSLGILWHYATRYLGMKPCEHEYKIMGLAPYAKAEHGEKIYEIMKDLFKIENLKFEGKMHKLAFPYFIKDKMYEKRFDNIAYGLQVLTERLICKWVKEAINKTGIHNIALAGGVFQNVKANMELAKMPEVDKIFVFPSPGDESTAIGACYAGFEYLDEEKKLKPLKDLYFGPEFTDAEIEKSIPKNYEYSKQSNIEKVVAEMLNEDKVVGRLNGKMEFGARALGNRTIMANPTNMDNIRRLNNTIKNRDFWMPFTPSMLFERQGDYIINPKKIPAPYMIMAFESTEKAQKEIRATLHPADFTTRPQLVEKSWNERYHKTLKEFEKLTGVGAILNTSFNLHGEPIILSPKDAIHTMDNSDLKYCVMGKYLVVKK